MGGTWLPILLAARGYRSCWRRGIPEPDCEYDIRPIRDPGWTLPRWLETVRSGSEGEDALPRFMSRLTMLRQIF